MDLPDFKTTIKPYPKEFQDQISTEVLIRHEKEKVEEQILDETEMIKRGVLKESERSYSLRGKKLREEVSLITIYRRSQMLQKNKSKDT